MSCLTWPKKGTPARFQPRFSTTAIQVAGSFSMVIYGRWHNNATFLAMGWDWGSCFLLTGHNLPEKLIVDWPFGGGNWKGLTSLLEAFGMDREGQRKDVCDSQGAPYANLSSHLGRNTIRCVMPFFFEIWESDDMKLNTGRNLYTTGWLSNCHVVLIVHTL